jgi:hypothetical protein
MNAHVKKPPLDDSATAQRDFVLAGLRTVCKRLEYIREDLILAGVGLSTGAIDPQSAMRWCEEVAPGCLPIEVKATFIAKGWPL